MSLIVIYTTHPDTDHAMRICKALLEKKLIACSNIFPIRSMYWWKGKIVDSDECVSLVKTVSENWEIVKETIERMHEYEVPCIERIFVDSNESYAQWIIDETFGKNGIL
jgi:periplasmic divalent cation tolerance protein